MPTSKLKNKIIGITLGDPAGIGPEVVAKALKKASLHKKARFLLIGDQNIFMKYAPSLPKSCQFLDIKNPNAKSIKIGKPNNYTAKASLEYLENAINLVKAKKIHSIVTAPLSKEGVSSLGSKFQGHTEYLAEAFCVKKFGMMFIADNMRTIVVTRHIPLNKVSSSITPEKIIEAVSLTHTTLKKFFHIKNPKIAVCGLNPHAGEGGEIGKEEITTIIPAIKQARRRKIDITDPLPSDTLFSPVTAKHYDAVIAMYHDQGLIPLKTVHFQKLVNLTVGLPFVRTSPAHGTAYNIAGQNKADPSSMYAAIKLAVDLS